MTQPFGDDGFIRAIMANPEDEGLRLIYADWWDEQGADTAATIAARLRGPGRWSISTVGLVWWNSQTSDQHTPVGHMPYTMPCGQCRNLFPSELEWRSVPPIIKQPHWLCRRCIEMADHLAAAKILGHRTQECHYCNEHDRECWRCHNFRRILVSEVPPIMRRASQEVARDFSAGIRRYMDSVGEQFRVSAEAIGQAISRTWTPEELRRVDQIADEEGE